MFNDILRTTLVITISYVLGSLSFALILSNIIHGQDIRNYGSKNAGATNMMRIYGLKIALFTILGDMLKGILSDSIGNYIGGQTLGYLAGLFCILGHIYPIFYGFKGGKEVATGAAVALMTNSSIFFIMFIVFIACILLTKYVSLSSCVTACFFPILTFYNKIPIINNITSEILIIICTFIMSSLIIWKHSQNIKRLINKTEPQISFKR